MTKQTLLATAALATMALAGAANAGTITGTVGTVNYSSTVSKIIASEAADPTALAPQAADITVSTDLTNNITVASGSQVSFNVTFDVTGATFVGTPIITAEAGATDFVATSFLESDGDAFGVITIDNTSGTGTVTITDFRLEGVAVSATSAATISVSSAVAVVNGGTATTIDTAPAVNAVTYATYFNGFTATAQTDEAKLPNYVNFDSSSTASSSATLATGITAVVNSGSFYSTLNDTSSITVTEFVTDLTINVNGTGGAKLNLLGAALSNGSITPTTATDTSASFNLSSGSMGSYNVAVGGATDFSLTAPGNVVINAADYTVSFVPTFGAGFTTGQTVYGPLAAGTVTLEGTNFIAPWIAIGSTSASSALRIANNGTTTTGPIILTLLSSSSTTPATTGRATLTQSQVVSGTLVNGGIAAGQQIVISGNSLAALFGTAAANGDVQVTIQADGTNLSAKVRTNVGANTFEASLGNLETAGNVVE